jgi:hypothetical protein
MNEITPSFEMISSRIEHEDNLLNQRVSWIVSSQAFLLTGYAILLNAPLQPRSEQFQHDHALLMKLIPFTSIFVTSLLWIGILAGIRAIRELRARAKARPGFEAGQTLARPLTRAIGLAIPALIPVAFLLTWLWLLVL